MARTTPKSTGKRRRAAAPRAGSGASGEPERVVVENVNVPGHTTTLEAPKYHAMKKALLRVLPRRGPGLTQAEMGEAVVVHLPEDLFPGGAKAMWWAKSVQLDLEAKGVIVRDRTAKPLRWRRAK